MSLKTATVRQFGRPTGLVGKMAGHIMARRSSNRIRNHKTVELMSLRPDSRVLEIGCGPGLALKHCAALIEDGSIAGLDHSSVMIQQARKRLSNAHLIKKVTLYVGGIERLPMSTMVFDRIYSLNVIQFIPDKTVFFQKVYDALDGQGMCFTTYQPRMDNHNSNGAELMADETENLMLSVGFQTIERTKIEAGSTPAICISGMKPTG